ncbi:hypothetical protein [Nannocystis sp. SCPEA4]|uniref:hypothetical protein n=1 Tax=Nannocystis sp. SCPEA4 TaxID=2996787 RepID=UPI00226F3F86|nr:hypothetical protein [Nannocystis sp. SCPEA4]MCY1058739.1 hypothetical protein [Nannocystis sp. SCPEA4]
MSPSDLPARRPRALARVPAVLEFTVAAAPAAVVDRFLAAPEVALLREHTGHGADPGYALERSEHGFHLTADPGAWRPGTRAICEVQLTPQDDGARVVVRFRLHPLTRTAFAYIIALGLAMTAFQLAIAGPVVAATLLVPFLIVVGLLAADRNSLRRQQRALRMLVEATLTPIAVPHERAPAAPFRRDTGD